MRSNYGSCDNLTSHEFPPDGPRKRFNSHVRVKPHVVQNKFSIYHRGWAPVQTQEMGLYMGQAGYIRDLASMMLQWRFQYVKMKDTSRDLRFCTSVEGPHLELPHVAGKYCPVELEQTRRGQLLPT